MHNVFESTQLAQDKIIKAVEQIGPIEGNNKVLNLKNVHFGDISGAHPDDFSAQKQARLHNKTFGVGIYADAVVEENGKKSTQRIKIGNLPVLTSAHSYVVDGSSYTIDHQLRLKPGAYLRQKASGEVETHINPEGFPNARVTIDPKTLKMTVGIGQANINALSFMSAVGMSEAEQVAIMGKGIYEANALKLNHPKEYQKLATFLSTDKKPVALAEVPAALKLRLESAKLDPRVSQITLGKPLANLGKETLKTIIANTIAGSRGEVEMDERDGLAFKHVHSVEDFIHDRIAGRQSIHGVRYDLKNALFKDKPLNEAITSNLLDSRIHPLFSSSSISEFAPRDNPLQMMGAARKVTSTGEGGLENEHSITPDTQAVHPSQAFFIDPIDTPESSKIGITLKFALGTTIKDNELHAEFRNKKTGKIESKSPIDLFDKHVLLPSPPLPDGTVAVIHRGKQIQVHPKKTDYEPVHIQNAFAESSLIAPALQHNQANRAGMRARHAAQATSLVHREAPLVQSVNAISGGTWEDTVGGSSGPIVAREAFTIKRINNDGIHIETDSGKKGPIGYLKHDVGTNKAYFHHNIEHLKPGMHFKKGELVADTNFTKNGTLALGTNMHTAYMPWHGLNFEDGIVVSESGAQKLTSSHIATHDFDLHLGTSMVGKKQFVAAYPGKYTKAQLDKLDDHGMALEGTQLNPGDPIYLRLQRNAPSKEDMILGKLHKALVKPWKDSSQTWDGIHPATVTDSVLSKTFGKVNVVYDAPALVGDKLANRHGSKGVISTIVPDIDMPHTKDGKPIELILSPLSVITRMTMGQVIETTASKIAKKTGKPYLIESFGKDNELERVQKELKAHNLSDTEELIDPKTGHSYGQILTGYPVSQKLFKLAHGNIAARALGAYDSDHKPMGGGSDGSKAVDALTLYGLIGHGSRNIMNEISTVKGDYNPDFWQKLQMGMPLPKPQVPFAYKKFEGLLAASGINVRQDGNSKILAPFTDADIKKAAGDSIIKNIKMLDHKFEPITGGLFDIQLTGGSRGNKWSRIELPHSIPNPLFESAIKSVLSLDDKTYKGLLNHTTDIGGLTGHEAFNTMLKGISIPKEIDHVKESLAHAKSVSGKDELTKKLKLLKALDFLKLQPQDAYMIKNIPIIPPAFRPILELPNGSASKSSINMLYRDAGMVSDSIKQFGLDGESYHELYKAVGAIQGVNEPISPQAQKQNMKGAIKLITGATPKHGYFQSKVVRKQQDVSGRATLAMDNNLSIDELSIPRKVLQTIYKPFAIRQLVNQGYTVADAEKHIDDGSPVGKMAIDVETKTRPVLMNRSPTLHRFGIMAFHPKSNDTESVLMPGLVVKPYNADFDGDTVMLHVPATEAGRLEAIKMLPSNNLYGTRERKLNYMPDQEAVLGLHMLSQTPNGRKHLNSLLPPGSLQVDNVLNKAGIGKVLESVALKHPARYGEIATTLKETGDKFATMAGYSLSITDLKAKNSGVAKQMFDKALKRKAPMSELLKIDETVLNLSKTDPSNNLVKGHIPNARGNANNVKQILYAPGLLEDHNGNVLARPVTGNYGSGLNFADYWTTTYSARKGSIDKSLGTSKPGALNKEIVNSSMGLVISGDDCGTHEGLSMSASDPHIIGRTEVGTGRTISREQLKGKKSLMIRSPQTCEATHGICKKCYGLNESNNPINIGQNVGVMSAQAMSEPLTQAAMRTFHTGGTVSGGGGVFGGFEIISHFLQAPETFKNKASLATISGTITGIKPGVAGGHHIEINGTDHFVPPYAGALTVKKGQKISKGGLLNIGIPHPAEIIGLLGPVAGGQVVVDSLHNLYENSGISIDRKNIETVVRGLSGFAEIKDSGSHKTLTRGDTVGLERVRDFNSKAHISLHMKPEDAYGMITVKPIAGIAAGTEINADHIGLLHKHKTIEVKNRPIEFVRKLIGSSQAPTHTGDWLGNLNYRYLKRALEQGAMFADHSDVHGYHPIAPYVTGELQTTHPQGKY